MYRDLIINLALLISFLSISGQFFKDKPMNYSINTKLLGGIISGVLGSTLMFFAIQLTETTIMDLRNFAIIISSLYGGLISGLVAGVILAINRVLFFGISVSSITAVVTLILLPLICGLIAKMRISPLLKFIYMNVSNILVFTIAVSFLISDKHKLINAILYYGIISLLGGGILYFITEYISRSNANYRLLKESARKDFLTGLNNVREFDMIWNTHVRNARERKERLSLLLIDIDHFKKINDTYGHLAGDEVLKELGHVLTIATRSFDTVSRNGGEEFSVILPDCPNQQAIEIANRIRKTVESHEFCISSKETIKITISIGLATFPETIKDTEKMIGIADDCLYKAKHLGRNQVCSN